MKIGVLALQGAFVEHIEVLKGLGIETVEVRLPEDLHNINGLIIPGGESTTILKLMHLYKIFLPLKEKIRDGFGVLGTCAGMICLAKTKVRSSDSTLEPLSVMDIEVERNAFGRQVDSFEADLAVPALGEKSYHAVFIRAPLISKVKPGVQVLAKLVDGTIVAARQDHLLACSFHPELTCDARFHRYFVDICQGQDNE